ESSGSLAGALEYSTDLFEPDTVAGMVDAFGVLLRDAAARPGAPIAVLGRPQPDAMPPRSSELPRTAGLPRDSAVASRSTLVERLVRQMDRSSRRTAVVQAETRLSFGA